MNPVLLERMRELDREKESQTCSICCGELTLKNIVNPECGHSTCKDCFWRWAKDKNTCPFCRTSLLKNDQEINVPHYCFSTHLRLNTSTVFKPKKILIIEGILILNNRTLKNQINYSVFLDCSRDTRFKRRLKRDINERGRNYEDVIKLFENRLDKMHQIHVKPMKKECDLVLDTENNTNIDLLIDVIKKNMK